LFAHLKKHHIKYSLGYLLKSDSRFHEKGVDVNMAVDMLVATYEKLYDHIVLISYTKIEMSAFAKIEMSAFE